jgi:hypothetical protein
MRATVFLRSAAVLTFLMGVGHSIGSPWTPASDPLTVAVVAAMKSHRMHVMGFDRTFMDFYRGFGWTLSVDMFAQAVLLWMLTNFAQQDPLRARQVAVVFFVANAVQTVLAGVFLFTAPLVLSALIALCLGVAIIIPARAATVPA